MSTVDIRHRVSATAAVSFALLGLTVVVGVIIAWYATDHGLRGWLYAFGGSAEFFGLLLVAAPELVPILQTIGAAVAGGWRSLRALQRKAAARLVRLLGRPQHQRVVVGAGGLLLLSSHDARQLPRTSSASMKSFVSKPTREVVPWPSRH